jgi:hypothetical protein
VNDDSSKVADEPIDENGHILLPTGRELDLSKVQTYKVRVLLLDFNNLPDHIQPGLNYVVNNPVPVLGYQSNDRDREIGSATVIIEKDRILADLFIQMDCPERLDIEQKQFRLWPNTWFSSVFNDLNDIVETRINAIQPTRTPNNDPPIGDAIL